MVRKEGLFILPNYYSVAAYVMGNPTNVNAFSWKVLSLFKELQTPGIPARADLKVPGTFSIASL